MADDLISRQAAIDATWEEPMYTDPLNVLTEVRDRLEALPSAQQDIAEKLYLYKCYITDQEGLQHEVIHTGDIRRVTGWEI